jgi:ABC-type lipoprotein export system ATPase subunit
MTIELRGVTKAYGVAPPVLEGANLIVREGEVVWLRGMSGSGKTTALNIAGLLTTPDAGDVYVAGRETAALTDKELSLLRAQHLGFVFQAHNLLAHLTASENVGLAATAAHDHTPGERVAELLEDVEMTPYAETPAGYLSGGQQQRVAVARALLNNPVAVLADEPTSGLDEETASIVLGLLAKVARDGRAVLIASHDGAVAGVADRETQVVGGRIAEMGQEGEQ